MVRSERRAPCIDLGMNTCVVVADRARARFFILTNQEGQPPNRSRRLEELETLVDSEAELRGTDAFSNTRSGSNRAPHGAAFEYDDHRDRHQEEVARRFARRIAPEIAELSGRLAAGKVILVAEPHFLGLLRPLLSHAFDAGTALVDIAADLSWHTPEHILSVLHRRGALSVPAL